MITIKKINQEELEKLNVTNWPVWEKEISKFDWFYDKTEECFILEGEASVIDTEGKVYAFGKGDFVSFSKSLSVTWNIKKNIKKQYRFL